MVFQATLKHNWSDIAESKKDQCEYNPKHPEVRQRAAQLKEQQAEKLPENPVDVSKKPLTKEEIAH